VWGKTITGNPRYGLEAGQRTGQDRDDDLQRRRRGLPGTATTYTVPIQKTA